MRWSKRQIVGLLATLAGTFCVILTGLYFAWVVSEGWSGMQGMSFLTFAVIFGLVLFAIGGVMAIFVVMVIRKNEGKG